MLIERVHIGAPLREPPRQIGMAVPYRGREAAIDVAREFDESRASSGALLDGGQEWRHVLVVARIMIGAGRQQGIEHRHVAARGRKPERCLSEIVAGVEIGSGRRQQPHGIQPAEVRRAMQTAWC